MKKICIFSQSSYPLLVKSEIGGAVGGAEIQLYTIGTLLAKRGYELVYLVGEFNQPKIQKIHSNISAYKTPLRYLGGTNFYLIPDWLRLFVHLQKINADYHIIKLPNHLLLPLGIFCTLFRKKLIFICQIDRDVDLKLLEKSVNKLQYYMYRLGLKLTDNVVTQNNKQLALLKTFHSGKSTVIKNILGFITDTFYPKEKFIFWVGSNLERKRPKLFVEIAKRCPDLSFKMIMSSTDPNAGTMGVSEMCSGMNNIDFLGPVPFHHIGKFFQSAAIFVSTSELEGFPNVFLHSWQCSTPVVSLDIDPDGIINKWQLGRVASTIDDMVLNINELMSDDTLRKELGGNGKKYIQKHHDPEQILDKYCQLLK